MNFFNSLFGKITKSYNLSFEKQDYMVAEQLTDALLLSKRDGNYKKKNFYLKVFFYHILIVLLSILILLKPKKVKMTWEKK